MCQRQLPDCLSLLFLGLLSVSGCAEAVLSSETTTVGTPLEIPTDDVADLVPLGCITYPWSFLQFGSVENDTGTAVGVDKGCNVFVTGNTGGLLYPDAKRGKYQDSFVARLGRFSQPVWIRQFGTDRVDAARGITVSDDGTAYIVGDASSEDGYTGNVLTARISADGSLKWLIQHGTDGLSFGNAITLTQFNTILLGGASFSNPGGSSDIWLGRMTTDGVLLKESTYGSIEYDRIDGIALEPGTDSLYVAGSTLGDLGGSNIGSVDAYAAKVGSSWAATWETHFGTSDIDSAPRVVVDQMGNVYILTLSYSDLVSGLPENDFRRSVFVLKYSSSGAFRWIRRIGSAGEDAWSTGLTTDLDGFIYIAGTTNGRLGDRKLGGLDGFLARLDSNGNLQWLRQFGTAFDDIATSVVVTPANQVMVTGNTAGSLVPGSARGKQDVFLARFKRNGAQ